MTSSEQLRSVPIHPLHPTRPPLRSRLRHSPRLSDDVIRERITRIHHDLLGTSRYVRDLNFTAMHPNDLAFLFGAYDEFFLRTSASVVSTDVLCAFGSRRA
jgi:hypothetical protein